jgi:SAM-dependent methyltransferase
MLKNFFMGMQPTLIVFTVILKRGMPGKNFLDKYFRESMRRRFDLSIKYGGEQHIKTILDVGCGSGVYCEALLEKGKTVTGIDIADGMLELARKKTERFNNSGRINYIHDAYLAYTFNSKFDAAILTGFFDYIKSPLEIFEKLCKGEADDYCVRAKIDMSCKNKCNKFIYIFLFFKVNFK